MRNFYCHYFRIILTCILLMNTLNSFAQDSLLNKYTDISKIPFEQRFEKTISTTYINSSDNLENVFSSLKFTPGLKHKGPVPNDFVSKKAILKFNLANSSDTTAAVYFFPGFYFPFRQFYTA